MTDAPAPPDGDDRLTRVMLAHAGEAIVVVDDAGIVVRASRVAREFCADDPVGKPFHEAYPLQGVDGALFSLSKASRSAQRTPATLQLGDRNLSLLLRIGDADDPAAGLRAQVVVMTDISEHALAEEKVRSSQGELRRLLDTADRSRRALLSVLEDHRQTERALSDSERQFRDLVEQSVAGIYIVQDGVLAYVNPSYAAILGFGSPDELVGRDPRSFIDIRDHALIASLKARLAGGESVDREYTLRLIRKDGTPIHVSAHDTSSSYRGRPAIIGLMLDISAQMRAEAEAGRYLSRLRTAFLQTVEVATTIAQLRDPYTANHAKRVAHMLVAFGEELGWDATRIEGLRIGGFLHDIGAITIPAEIIVKPGRLNPLEIKLIRTHPAAGHDILKIVDFPWPVARMTLQHHERMDGSGYPAGLRGDDIIPEARLLAVADVVEAMCSHRPYRPAMGIEKALAEIESGRGTLYGEEAADACVRVFRERGYTLPPE